MQSERPVWPRPWPPEMVGTYRPDRELNLSQLPPEAKQAKWAEIQRDQPDLAALLKNPAFQALAAAFNADVLIEIDDERPGAKT